jgi:hypothetical protein
VVIGALAALTLLLLLVVMVWAAMVVLSRRDGEKGSHAAPRRAGSPGLADTSADTEDDCDLDLPPPVIEGSAPIAPLSDALGGGAFFSADWEEDEAATEVAVRAPIADAPPPPMDPFEGLDADNAATEVVDPAAYPQLEAAIRGTSTAESLDPPSGAYFDDEWDDEEAPTAIMTDELASNLADLLFDDDDD